MVTGNVNTNTNSTRYWCPLGVTSWASVEDRQNMPFRTPGTLSKFTVSTSSNALNANYVLTLRKNGSDTDAVITIPSSGNPTGEFEDNTHSVHIDAGDKLCWKGVTTSTGAAAVRFINMLFTPDDDSITDSRLALTGFASVNSSVTYYYPPCGQLTDLVTSNTNTRYIPGVAGSFKYWASYSNLGGRTWNARMMKNNTDDAVNRISFGSNVTGLSENTADTITIDDDDDVNYLTVYGASGTTRDVDFLVGSFQTSDNKSIYVGGDSAGASINSGQNNSTYLNGFLIISNSAIVGMKAKTRLKFTGLRIYVGANTINTGNTLCRFFVNGSAGNQVATIPAGQTGWFMDTTHSDEVGPDDEVNYNLLTSGSSGSLTFYMIGSIAENVPITMTNVDTKIRKAIFTSPSV
jgi:hypothetical protein